MTKSKWRNTWKKWIPLPLNGIGIFLIVAHTYHLIQAHITSGVAVFTLSLSETVLILTSYLTVLTLLQLINSLTSRSRWGNFAANAVFLLLYALFSGYLFTTKSSLDFAVIMDNFSSTFHRESLGVIVSSFTLDPLIIAVIAILVFLGLELKWKTLSKKRPHSPLLPKIVLTALLYITFIILPIPSQDETTNFVKTIYTYYFNPHIPKFKLKPNEYPFVAESFKHTPYLPGTPSPPPHIFIIMVESFNASVIEAKTETGTPITPYLNKLIQKGVYIDHFYSNSVQTSKGHFAILSGILPSIQGIAQVTYPKLSLSNLPTLLKQEGYLTLFFQAHSDLKFDNAQDFMSTHGFDIQETVHTYLTEEDKPYVWGWGPEDHIFYKRFFNYLDTLQEKNQPNTPYFVALPTINNHMRFLVPENRRFLYKNPTSPYEQYANSVYLVDQHLKVFFEELKKRPYLKESIVIITGDHSFPLGSHGIHHNEVGFYEESFRVPFLLLWEGKLAPLRLKNKAFSQVDIAPTLIDLLNLPVSKHHFIGQSIFSDPPYNPTYLVQPYNGKYLSVVDYPFKYIKHLRTHKEYLFNLEKDPKETQNLVKNPTYHPTLTTLRDNLTFIFLSQHLLQNNRIWPATPRNKIGKSP